MKPWLQLLVACVVAIVFALLIIFLAGRDSVNEMLIYSSAILSFQLPFAIVPLVIFAFYPAPSTVDADPPVAVF